MRRCLSLILPADYGQFTIHDASLDPDPAIPWDRDKSENLLATGPGALCIGTLRTVDVPVRIDLGQHPGPADVTAWDHVNECSVFFASGTIVISGSVARPAAAHRLSIESGWHRARIFYGGLASARHDSRTGADRYAVALWRFPPYPPLTLRRWRQAVAA